MQNLRKQPPQRGGWKALLPLSAAEKLVLYQLLLSPPLKTKTNKKWAIEFNVSVFPSQRWMSGM